ncbi:MAG: hypothetical protein JSU04_18575 [Bdellovibrionales bacterium]|nr:hypothetical protein [Bdellovibrionales bacterium]
MNRLWILGMVLTTGVVASAQMAANGLGLVAPTSDALANISQPQTGEIVFNNSDSTFYGNAGTVASPTWVAFAGSGVKVAPLTTRYTSGSGTHTLTGSPLYIRIRMVGGGAGGNGSAVASGGSNGGAGGGGGTTTFGSQLIADGGNAGNTGGNTFANSPGTATCGTITDCKATRGGYGAGVSYQSANNEYSGGGMGGVSPFGGAGSGGSNGAGSSAAANTGSGGGGGGGPSSATGSVGGPGGSSGGYVEATIASPASSYTYSVGAGGSGGSAGTSGYAGGAGGSGYIEVTEYYQ